MTLVAKLKEALTSSTPESSNGAGSSPATPGGGAAGLLEKHKQVSSGRGGARPGSGRKPGSANKVDAPISTSIAPLYSSEAGEHVQRALFGTVAVLSKRDAFALEDDEAKTLGPLTSSCLNQFTPGGEKWVALSVLSVSMLSIFTAKARLVQAEIKAEKILALSKTPKVAIQPQASAPKPNPTPAQSDIPGFISPVPTQ